MSFAQFSHPELAIRMLVFMLMGAVGGSLCRADSWVHFAVAAVLAGAVCTPQVSACWFPNPSVPSEHPLQCCVVLLLRPGVSSCPPALLVLLTLGNFAGRSAGVEPSLVPTQDLLPENPLSNMPVRQTTAWISLCVTMPGLLGAHQLSTESNPQKDWWAWAVSLLYLGLLPVLCSFSLFLAFP